MTQDPAPMYLSVARALDYIGDADAVMTLLTTLQQTLGQDLPRIQALLDQGDLQGVNRLLHQLKGFTPVFCVDSLVAQVVKVEHLSKLGDLVEVRDAYRELAPQLAQLQTEVGLHLKRPPQA